MQKPPPTWKTHLAVFGVYLALAVIITYPVVTTLTTHFAGLPHSDAYEMAHHIWWFTYALQTGESPFSQPLMGYPDGIEGITLWSNPLQFFPAWLLALIVPLPAAYNLTILLYLALNGWSMYWLARHLTGATVPALLAGVVFMAYPTMQAHLAVGHVGLLVQYPLPLYVYALLRLRDADGRRAVITWTLITAAFYVMSAWGHTLQMIYATLPLSGLYALWLLTRREWRSLRRTVIAGALGSVILALFLLPVASATLNTQIYADEGGAVRFSSDLLAVVTPSPQHPLFGQLDYTHRVLGVNLDEGAAYVGLVAAVLASIAVWGRAQARFWLWSALVIWVLSLGPLLKIFDERVALNINEQYESYVTLPWAALSSLPVFELARAPGRFNFALALTVAVMAGYGASVVWGRIRQNGIVRYGLAVALIAVILFEYQVYWGVPRIDSALPGAITALGDRDDIRATFDLPWSNPVAAKDSLYLQTARQQAMLAGHVTRTTPVDPAKLYLLQAKLDPALLHAVGADVVLIHRWYDFDGSLEGRARDQLGDPVYADERFALFETPGTDADPTFTVQLTGSNRIDDDADSYVYAPVDGWAHLHAEVDSPGRTLALQLGTDIIRRWQIDGEQDIHVALPLRRGFHRVRLLVEPVCPRAVNRVYRCTAVELDDLRIADFEAGALSEPVAFEDGLTLAGSRVTDDDEQLAVDLWWRFERPRRETDIRFIHVLDDDGRIVAQSDDSLGEMTAGETWVEMVTLALPPTLPAGTYRVVTGWYRQADGARFAVPGVVSDVVEVGTVTLTSAASP